MRDEGLAIRDARLEMRKKLRAESLELRDSPPAPEGGESDERLGMRDEGLGMSDEG